MDVVKRRLWRGDQLVRLTRKAFDTLLTLVEHGTQVVDKEDLLRIVWPDTFVSDETLAQNIATIRRALGDSATNPEYIATGPKRGYQIYCAGDPRAGGQGINIRGKDSRPDRIRHRVGFRPPAKTQHVLAAFDFDFDPPRMATMHAILDPVQDDLRAFADAGGKMIIYQGWGDISESPYRTLQYYLGRRRHQGRRAVEDFARLFLAPGRRHRAEHVRRLDRTGAIGRAGERAVLHHRDEDIRARHEPLASALSVPAACGLPRYGQH